MDSFDYLVQNIARLENENAKLRALLGSYLADVQTAQGQDDLSFAASRALISLEEIPERGSLAVR